MPDHVVRPDAGLDFADMGFTRVWINPVLENAMERASYHGYSTTDFYRVDPRFGSNEEYRDFVAAARAKGIGVIMDMIVNHVSAHSAWFKAFLAGDPDFIDAYVFLSLYLTSLQQYKQAEAVFDRAYVKRDQVSVREKLFLDHL